MGIKKLASKCLNSTRQVLYSTLQNMQDRIPALKGLMNLEGKTGLGHNEPKHRMDNFKMTEEVQSVISGSSRRYRVCQAVRVTKGSGCSTGSLITA